MAPSEESGFAYITLARKLIPSASMAHPLRLSERRAWFRSTRFARNTT